MVVDERLHRLRLLDEKLEAKLQNLDKDATIASMDVLDAKIAAAEARTDTKFAELRGDLKGFATKGTVWGAVASGVVAVLGVLVGLLAFGGDRFDAGIGMADRRQEQIVRDQKQDEAVQRIEVKIDKLISQRPNQ